ncbi:hypothetical protein AB0953_17270 [Streptomyces sp. NPDC046866]|uniref:hypothetical protein n=1 Tax=Streptomyces sp. NPDC046866 TaxID=3154921 RepID=UPI003454348D
MDLRRVVLPLPLVLAVLAPTAGCVTVRPHGPAAAGGAARGERVVEALPLGPLPTSAPTPSPSPTPSGDPAPEAPRPPAVRYDGPRPTPPRRAGGRPAPRPEHPAKAPATPLRRPAEAYPVPGHGYDMAALCEAAKGRVSPAIVALCR